MALCTLFTPAQSFCCYLLRSSLSLTRRSFGYVFACGAGFGGRLGHQHEHDKDVDSLYPLLCDVHASPSKEHHNIGAALPPPDSKLAPRLLKGVSKVAAGDMHSLAVTEHYSVISWGFGDSGALGRPKINEGDFIRCVCVCVYERERARFGLRRHSRVIRLTALLFLCLSLCSS